MEHDFETPVKWMRAYLDENMTEKEEEMSPAYLEEVDSEHFSLDFVP